MQYIAGFSGLASSGEGGTREIVDRIPGAEHFINPTGLGSHTRYVTEIVEQRPSFIALFGHSKGAEQVLQIATGLAEHNIMVDYIGIIDMTYWSRGVAGPNIKLMQEFHSAYAHARKHEDFMGEHELFELDQVTGRNVGHSEAAQIQFTQDTIVETIARLRKEPAVADEPFYIGDYKPLEDIDYVTLAREYGLDEAHVRAVVEVESAGKGSHSSGAVVALYEPHVAYRNTSGKTRDALVRNKLAYADWRPGTYPKSSYPRIDKCVDVVASVRGDEEAGVTIAALASSWGLGQMLGENYRLCGYSSAGEMVRDFAKGEKNQLRGMLEFIKNAGILDDLREGNWNVFARRYNGPRYATHNYHGRLKAAYNRWVEAIEDRGQIPVIVPEEPEKPAQPFSELEELILMEFPLLSPAHAQFILAMRKYGQNANSPPDSITEGEIIAQLPPATERVFSSPNSEKETDMSKILDMLPLNGNKTYIGIILWTILSILAEQPGWQISDWMFDLVLAWTGVGFGHKLEKLNR